MNNTIVIGSLALGLWLFYPVYFLTSRSVMWFQKRYGTKVAERLKKYRLYQAVLGADLIDQLELGAMIRWGYLIPRLILVAAVAAFLGFGLAPLLRWSIVTYGSQALGARIDIDDVGPVAGPR